MVFIELIYLIECKIDLIIRIKQTILIAIGWPKNPIINPIIRNISGMIIAFFKSKTLGRYSLSALIFIKYLLMINKIISIKMKSKPYKDSLNREFGLFATKIVK